MCMCYGYRHGGLRRGDQLLSVNGEVSLSTIYIIRTYTCPILCIHVILYSCFRGVYILQISRNKNFLEDCTHEITSLGMVFHKFRENWFLGLQQFWNFRIIHPSKIKSYMYMVLIVHVHVRVNSQLTSHLHVLDVKGYLTCTCMYMYMYVHVHA